MLSSTNILKLILALILTGGSTQLPVVGDVGRLIGDGAIGTVLGFFATFLVYWVIVSKVWEFLVFAFGGGVGRYNTTKLYRRLQWLTFSLFMTLPLFCVGVFLVAATPIGKPSETFLAAVARVEAQRLQTARADQRSSFDDAVAEQRSEIARAEAVRRSRITVAQRERLQRIDSERARIRRNAERVRDGHLTTIADEERDARSRISTFVAQNPLVHGRNEAYRNEIDAFVDALQRRFDIRFSRAHRTALYELLPNELDAFKRFYIDNSCARRIQREDAEALKRARSFELCTAFVVWLNFDANALFTADGQSLALPIIRSLSDDLRALPPIYQKLNSLEQRKEAVADVFDNAVTKANRHTEPPIREANFALVDLSQFPAIKVSDFPLRVDQSPIAADDPYLERVSPTFEAYWWWIAPAAFVTWLIVQAVSQRFISRLYGRIIRFLDEGRYGFGGSARFTSMFEEWGKPFKRGTLYMGRSLYNSYDEVGLDGEAHMITIAGSRGGKGTSAIIPNLLLWEGSCVVVDPKGTNAHVTAEARRKMGHQVYMIDPFGIVTDKSDRFDPFDGLDPSNPLVRERIASIADALVIPDDNAKEKHWDDGARTIIAGLISHVVSGQVEGAQWLHSVRDLIKRLPEDQDRMWAEMTFNEGAGGYAKDAAVRYIRGSETNEILGIMSNADKHTEWLSSQIMRHVTSEPTFRLSDLKKQPTTVYLIIPPRQLTKQNRLIRLFINLMLDVMEDGGRSDVPVLMMIDEFLALDKMPEIPTAFATMASYNLVLWLFIQDLKGLQKKYEDEFNAFIANSRAVQVFSTSDDVTKTYVSERLGNRPLSGLAAIARSNENLPLRSKDDVEKDLKASELRQYVIEAGNPAMLLERVPYFKPGSRFAGKYAPDPDFSR